MHSSYSYYFRLYFFPLFYRLFFRRRRHCSFPPLPKKILFLRPGKLGDMIVASLIFKQIKQAIPGVHCAVACSPENNVIVKHDPNIDTLLNVNFHDIKTVLGLIRKIRRERFDVIVDLSPGMSSTNFFILQWGGPQACLMGSDKELQEPFYDIPVRFTDEHIIERNLAITEIILQKKLPRPFRTMLVTAGEHRQEAEKIHARLDPDNHGAVGLNLSAGSIGRQLTRQWYRDLLRLFKPSNGPAGMPVFLFSIGKQTAWAREFCREFSFVKAVPACSILTIYEIIKHLTALVSPDTSLIHLASAHNVPVVGIYGTEKNNFNRWRPYCVPERIVFSPDGYDLRATDVRAVHDAVVNLLAELG
ncbi:MAG: glycosyltransferase family 9 protein [Chitinivibrionales bacterium]|nr:glycosyltransferase family 9 protein [Chitinivibrionales bacterium]